MVNIKVFYWDNELKSLDVNETNEKETKNAISLIMDMIFTVIGPYDGIYLNDTLINSPERLLTKLEEEIKKGRGIEIKIRPVLSSEEVELVEKKPSIEKIIDTIYITRF